MQPMMVKVAQPEPEAAPAPELKAITPQAREMYSAPAMRAYLNLAEAWQLTTEERRALLGWPAESTYFKYRAGNVGTLSHDQMVRISLVLGIYKALHTLYAEPAMADRWIRLPNSNSIFGGRPPIQLMMDAGQDGLYQVRRLLDARCAG